ncbi:unnamed protein product [Phytomonas sp. EM1]|nr:unnamed protein product [Phytomonas sp. EM1]|eukprot:CCW63432.1 unnamed protein product [Phytomonas sp. isolate EM1]
MSSVAPKAFPKTLHQFRNFTYIMVAWYGFMKGYKEREENNAAWKAHRDKIRQQNFERSQAAGSNYASSQGRGISGDQVPSGIPKSLHEVYHAVAKSMG